MGIVWRKLPDGVNVVWQNANRDGLERRSLSHGSVDAAEAIDVPHQ
jgi:hypothetical protein